MNSRHSLTSIAILALIYTITYIDAKPSTALTNTSKNHDLLTKLGMQKIRGPNTHHRKRLAVESRHHSRSDDSHMFVIKLPPHPHYYAYNQPEHNTLPVSKKIPVGFKSNGKPGKIYHWNIPVIKKIVAAKKATAVKNKHKSMKSDKLDMIDLQKPESWNEVLKIEKPVRNKPLKPSYYVPAKPKKSNFMKYFPGNGKPHSFYVIEKSKKAHYHRLLP